MAKHENFVCYVGEDEVIVCTIATQEETLKQFFGNNNRDLCEYDCVIDQAEAVSFSSFVRKN